MSDQDPKAAARDERAAGVSAVVEQRLRSIVQAVEGQNVGANDTELWFEPAAACGLQIRLGADAQARCYDRSANFSISYGGGEASEPVAAGLQDVIARIKALDSGPIADVSAAFPSAAHAVAGRGAASGAGDAAESAEAIVLEPQDLRQLNIVFLDLCARLVGQSGRSLPSLHWGFWPTRPGAAPATGSADDAYDPFEAFSENLLAHLPDGVERILDVGCGLGANTRLLAARNKRVTALSPVAHHCAAIAAARLPGVDVRCSRFEDLLPGDRYDLLLFSESVNHFSLLDGFFRHCARFLRPSGFMLMADDLSEAHLHKIETQQLFRLLHSVDITANVAPTTEWWARQMPAFCAYHAALQSILELRDPAVASRVQEILEGLDNPELKALLSGRTAPPAPKGRYMIYLLQLR